MILQKITMHASSLIIERKFRIIRYIMLNTCDARQQLQVYRAVAEEFYYLYTGMKIFL